MLPISINIKQGTIPAGNRSVYSTSNSAPLDEMDFPHRRSSRLAKQAPPSLMDVIGPDVVDIITSALSPATMARASVACAAFHLSVNRVVQQSTTTVGRLGTFGGATLAPSDGEGWASVARYAEQLRQFPLGGCENDDDGGGCENCEAVFPPPADRGERRDNHSFLCTSDATLVYDAGCRDARMPDAGFISGTGGLCRVQTATGNLEDLCHNAADDPGPPYGIVVHRANVWKPRALPLRCELCEVECDSAREFVTHCELFSHRQLAVPENARVPPTFIDPRLLDSANTVPLATLYQDVTDWHARVVRHLTHLDDGDVAGWAEMRGLAEWAGEIAEKYPDESDMTPGRYDGQAGAQLAFDVCSECFALADFYSRGLWPGGSSYAMEVICKSWANFEFFGSCSERGFLASMTGVQF